MSSRTIKFTKMHGIGNDFVMVNGFQESIPEHELADVSKAVCDRKFGVGSDGLILALPGKDSPFRMRMFNPDGSESEMCGNGVRCFIKFLHDERLTQEREVPVETGAGELQLVLRDDGQVQVDMGLARLKRGEIGMTGPASETFVDAPVNILDQEFRGTAVGMGNPHLVIFSPNVADINLRVLGPALENLSLFPARVNVHFVQVVHPGHIVQRTWERGAGITLACGTGACACAVASYLNGHTGRAVDVKLPGGTLQIYYREDERVYMTGPAETIFSGEFSL